MKIAINADYGGFGLSNEAQIIFYKKKYEKLYFYKNVYDSQLNLVGFEKISETEFMNKENDFNCHIKYKDVGQYVSLEKDYSCDCIVDCHLFMSENNRTDADLIEVIETLGEEKASGKFSKIKIIEIPDDADNEIEEYDGNEWIAEKHRTWR